MTVKPNTHNGFILKYDGSIFPPSNSNRISYDCFCLMGGLANGRLDQVKHENGSQIYWTYHRLDIR